MTTMKLFLTASGLALALSLLLATACNEPIEGFAASGGGGAGADGGASSAGGASTGGEGGTASGTSTGEGGGAGAPESLPFAVDDYFAPSGFMGDGEGPGQLTEDNDCPMRAGEEAGRCHRLDYTTGNVGWAGIYWQYPDGNWGTSAGLSVPDEPARITFWAWSEQGGETVDFFAGGIGDMNTAYQDTFSVSQQVTLTTTPTEYTLEIGNEPHAEVIGGFGWSAGGASDGTLVFFVDDIQYRPSP
jgi:hypothetical protein